MGRRPREGLVLSEVDRDKLMAWVRSRRTDQALALRARIVLSCTSRTNDEVAQILGVWPQTVGRWRSRYIKYGIQGLHDQPRAGAPKKVDPHAVLVKTLTERAPEGGQWTTRSLGQSLGLSQTTISKIWRNYGIHPNRLQDSGGVGDADFEIRVRDVVGLYLFPTIQFLAVIAERNGPTVQDRRTLKILESPSTPTDAETGFMRDLSIASGHIIHSKMKGSQGRQIICLLRELEITVPQDYDIHLLMHMAPSHKTTALMMWLLKHPRFRPHFSTLLAAWLKNVGQRLQRLGAQQEALGLRRSSLALIQDFKASRASIQHDQAFRWVKSNDEIRRVITHYLHRS